MKLGSRIMKIRKENGLTQKDFADKLFVTRQAVSRWENDDTTPAMDTLKTIAELFKIDANSFFGLSEAPICQSCSMPLQKLDEIGKNADNTANPEFCIHCFNDGKYTHNRTLDEMVEFNLKFLNHFNAQNNTNYTENEARTILKGHLAALKRWKQN